jgi:hypothetical protein
MTHDKAGPKTIVANSLVSLRGLQRYRLFIFVGFVVLLYGFVLLRINNLTTAQPSSDAVASHVQASHSLHIDKPVVQQLQSLQDNSVSVQSLFNQARANPFQE